MDAQDEPTGRGPSVPTLRELELETLVRERDAQVARLSNEVKLLRRYLPNSLNPDSKDDNKDFGASNPKLLAVLMPHILPVSVMGPDGTSGSSAASVPHPGVMNALVQRAKLLQEENDELYAVLRRNETGKLDEEVKALRRILGKLERSLRESNETVRRLNDELDLMNNQITKMNSSNVRRSPSRSDRDIPSPINSRSNPPLASPHASIASLSSNKPIPTAPRAHKKPRLNTPPPAPKSNGTPRERRPPTGPRSNVMDVDEPRHGGARRNRDRREPERRDDRRDRDRERDRGRTYDSREHTSREHTSRDRDRERDRERLDRELERDRVDRERSERPGRESARGTPVDDRDAPSRAGNGLQIRGMAGRRHDRGGGSAPNRPPPRPRGGGRSGGDRGLLDRIGS